MVGEGMIKKWYYRLLWRSHRVLEAAWTTRDKHYFVIEGSLYVMHTNGSPRPSDWVWELVTYL